MQARIITIALRGEFSSCSCSRGFSDANKSSISKRFPLFSDELVSTWPRTAIVCRAHKRVILAMDFNSLLWITLARSLQSWFATVPCTSVVFNASQRDMQHWCTLDWLCFSSFSVVFFQLRWPLFTNVSSAYPDVLGNNLQA